jgi:hypothetical protein
MRTGASAGIALDKRGTTAVKPWGSTFTFDVTPKASGQWTTLEEAGVYTVKDDKIRREQFFHDGEQ